jgi:hypothetical protein
MAPKNATYASLVRRQTFDPHYQWAKDAHDNMTPADKKLAAQGVDPRQLKSYDVFRTKGSRLESGAPMVKGATAEQVQADLEEIGIAPREEEAKKN